MKLHKKTYAIFLSLALFLHSGCAVFMAANQPSKKDTSLFAIGTQRSLLLAEFGPPVISEIRAGKNYDIYKFVQGYSGIVKVGRAAFHGAADFFTIGLWEVVGTPAEAIFDGNEMAFEVSYDMENRIDKVTNLREPLESVQENTGYLNIDTQE